MSAVFKTSSTTIAIFIAMAIAIIMYVVLNKTTFGYELKACGFNKDAAKYAGINEKRNIVLSMTISGALAGIGAGLYYLSGASEWNPQVSTALPAIGFNGIPVALLAAWYLQQSLSHISPWEERIFQLSIISRRLRI